MSGLFYEKLDQKHKLINTSP